MPFENVGKIIDVIKAAKRRNACDAEIAALQKLACPRQFQACDVLDGRTAVLINKKLFKIGIG